jgi:Ser/Thr protein kinase RdoA (MazF antagonist)
MHASDVARAVEAAASQASQLGLRVDHAIVLNNSNKLTVHLMPCDVVARVAHVGREALQFEIDVAQRLAAAGAPVAALDPRVEPRPYLRDGFLLTLWTHYEPVVRLKFSSSEYASALAQLHAGLRTLDVAMPHFTERVAEAQAAVADRGHTPVLADSDRALLSETLRVRRRAIGDHGAGEQPLHGEPHPGNVLGAGRGLVFIDFETGCRGPVEFDLAHVPEAVSASYGRVDDALLLECRVLVLAMVAAWRCEAGDQLPNRDEARDRLLRALRDGPPWPTLDTVTPPAT